MKLIINNIILIFITIFILWSCSQYTFIEYEYSSNSSISSYNSINSSYSSSSQTSQISENNQISSKSATNISTNFTLKLYYKDTISNNRVLLVDNNAPYPYQVLINFSELNNCVVYFSNEIKNEIFVIVDGFTKSNEILEIRSINKNKQYSYSFIYYYYYGNPFKEINNNFEYILPYAHGTKHKVSQGYNGNFTHFGDDAYCLDFTMDIGTEIYAARSGYVIKIKEDSKTSGTNQYDYTNANFIQIYHPEDDTFAIYAHLDYNGVLVNLGEWVEKGQLIGYSGNTGYSTGPHLHFSISKPRLTNNLITIPTKFLNYDGNLIELEEGHYYYSTHPDKPKYNVILGELLSPNDFVSSNFIIETDNKFYITNYKIDDTTVFFVHNGLSKNVKLIFIMTNYYNLNLSLPEISTNIISSNTYKFLLLVKPQDLKDYWYYSYNYFYNYQ